MDLFERVKLVAKRLAGSETKLAATLNLSQRKFNGYLNTVSQRNLWEHLPAILGVYPQINRDWLFFGEGEMLKSGELNKEIELSKQEPVSPLILAEQLVQSAPDEVVTLRAEVAALTKDLITTQKDLIAAKDRIIELQRNQRQGNALISTAE